MATKLHGEQGSKISQTKTGEWGQPETEWTQEVATILYSSQGSGDKQIRCISQEGQIARWASEGKAGIPGIPGIVYVWWDRDLQSWVQNENESLPFRAIPEHTLWQPDPGISGNPECHAVRVSKTFACLSPCTVLYQLRVCIYPLLHSTRLCTYRSRVLEISSYHQQKTAGTIIQDACPKLTHGFWSSKEPAEAQTNGSRIYCRRKCSYDSSQLGNTRCRYGTRFGVGWENKVAEEPRQPPVAK
jgi:hypothetical protein